MDYGAKLTGSEDSQDAGVDAICFGHSGSLLATGHRNGVAAVGLSSGMFIEEDSDQHFDVEIWNFPAQTLVHQLQGHETSVDAVVFVHLDTILVSQSFSDSIFTWDVESGTRLHRFKTAGFLRLAGSPRHQIIFVSLGLPFIKPVLCDAQLGGRAELPAGFYDAVFTPDGSKFICGHEGLTVWNLRPVLDQRELRTNGTLPLSDISEPNLHVTLDGPRVSPIPPVYSTRP